jgi:hypothetical protein
MTRFSLIYLFTMTFALPSKGCDVCGCGPGAGFTGLLAGQEQNFFGLRSGFQLFNHPETPYNFNGESQVFQDQFIRNEFWYRHFINEKTQVMVQVPYQIHVRQESLRTSRIQGVGDIQVNLLRKMTERDGVKYNHRLFVGGGVGLPTGTYMQRDENMTLLPDRFQIGAGAFSGMVRTMGFFERKSWGLFVDAGYRIAGENEQTFRMGNQTTANMHLYRKQKLRDAVLLPAIGFNFEHFEKDLKFNQTVSKSGGSNLLLHAGVDCYTSKWIVQLFAQQVVWHNLPGAMPIPGTRIGLTLARAKAS